MRCSACGSSKIRSSVSWRPGVATLLGLISAVSCYFGLPLGNNLGGVHDLHSYHYCEECGCKDITDTSPVRQVAPMKDDGGGCCGCCFFLLLLLFMMCAVVYLYTFWYGDVVTTPLGGVR